MPAFLESDLYMEYRLANLVSQAKITGEHGEYILMRIDFKPKVKHKKKVVEEEVEVDPKEQMMKDMYVCMGTASTTDTEAWFTAASMATVTSVSSSTQLRPRSAEMTKRPVSARPVSAYSSVDNYKRSESGLASSVKSSLYSNYRNTQNSDDYDDVYSSKLFAVDGKPMTPRPTDSVCAVTEDYRDKLNRPFSSTVYSIPKVDNSDAESGLDISDDTDSVDSKDNNDQLEMLQNEGQLSSRKGSSDSIVFKNIDDIGTAIVGAVLKRTVSSILNVHDNDLPLEILDQIPGCELSRHISLEHLDRISLQEVQLPEEDSEADKVTEEQLSEKDKKKEEESDADSLLDSEDDYEEEDTFFRKHKAKTFKLTNRKGTEKFKAFLSGTMGERNWNLWLDIDKTRFMTDDEAIHR